MVEFIIEKATADHVPDLAAIHVASKKEAYKNIIDHDFLASKTLSEYKNKWSEWLADEGIEVPVLTQNSNKCGFISYGRMQTAPPGTSKIRPIYSAEIFAIHIHPDYWKQGFGYKLLSFAVDVLRDEKHQGLCLWVLKDNSNAIGFYDRFKGQRLGKRDVQVGPNKVKEICYGWRDMSVILEGK